jgi:hypothetical protein
MQRSGVAGRRVDDHVPAAHRRLEGDHFGPRQGFFLRFLDLFYIFYWNYVFWIFFCIQGDRRLPVLGTCAGLILLADQLEQEEKCEGSKGDEVIPLRFFLGIYLHFILLFFIFDFYVYLILF